MTLWRLLAAASGPSSGHSKSMSCSRLIWWWGWRARLLTSSFGLRRVHWDSSTSRPSTATLNGPSSRISKDDGAEIFLDITGICVAPRAEIARLTGAWFLKIGSRLLSYRLPDHHN